MEITWFKLLSTTLGSGATVKLIDYIYKEYLRRSEQKNNAKDLVDKHIEPILKSADELVGKIRSLAQSDFKNISKKTFYDNQKLEICIPFLSIVYLFAQFWGRVQILRIDSLFVSLNTDKRGKQLQKFFNALESSRSRLVDRAWQKGMGEAIMDYSGNGIRILTFYEFVQRFKSSEELREWYMPLIHYLTHSNHKKYKQRILIYGIILHALTKTLDKDSIATKSRPGWANKLTKQSKRNLQFRIFKIYLSFVEDPGQYYHKKKNRP